MASDLQRIEATALLAAIVKFSHDAIVSKDLNGIVTSWNAGAARMFGYASEEIVGRSILTIIPPDRHSEESYILDQARAGKTIENYDTVRVRKDGGQLHVSLCISPILGDDGRILGISKIARDITGLKIAQQTQNLLLRELNHRSKNLLAVADAILRQTAKNTPPQELVSRVSRRFQALSVNQDLLIDKDWRGVELEHVVRSQLAALIDDAGARLAVGGPTIVLTPAAAQAIGLAIFELASNALKFGSLSAPHGRVDVDWRVSGESQTEELVLSWRESGGPRIKAPKHKGFGSTVIEGMVARSLVGRASVDYAPTGIVWQLVAPTASLLGAEVA
jgi:PAS domain S-box-containing protein